MRVCEGVTMDVQKELVDVIARDETQESVMEALHWCIDCNHADIIDNLLVTHFAKSKIRDILPDCDAVLTSAMKKGKKEIVLQLLPHLDDSFNRSGVDMVTRLFCIAVTRGFEDLATVFMYKGAKVNVVYNGRPLLHTALEQGATTLARNMVSCGADVHSLNANGESVYFAAMKKGSYTRAETLTMLMKQKADWTIPNVSGKLPIHVSAQTSGSLTMEFVAAGCDANARDLVRRNTPLHYACAACCNESIVALIRNGAVVNAANNNGETPLVNLIKHMAAYRDSRSESRYKTARNLVRAGCTVGQLGNLSVAMRRKVSNIYRCLTRDGPALSLRNLSRSVVIECLGGVHFRSKTAALEIPNSVRAYICYDDLVI